MMLMIMKVFVVVVVMIKIRKKIMKTTIIIIIGTTYTNQNNYERGRKTSSKPSKRWPCPLSTPYLIGCTKHFHGDLDNSLR